MSAEERARNLMAEHARLLAEHLRAGGDVAESRDLMERLIVRELKVAFDDGKIHARQRDENADRSCGCHWWCACGIQNLAMRDVYRRCGEPRPPAKATS
jgi:hypothetical protein